MATKKQDNLFADTTMTFGEHIEELRKSLMRALMWAVIGFFVGAYFAKYVVEGIQTPLKAALETYYLDKAKDDLELQYEGRVPPEIMTIVRDYELIPVQQQVDLFALSEQLHRDYPDHFGDLAIERHQFAATDIALDDVAKLAARLTEDARQDERSLAGAMLAALPEPQRQAVQEIAAAGKEQETAEGRRALVAALNTALSQPELFFAAKARLDDGFLSQLAPATATPLGKGKDEDIRLTLEQSLKQDQPPTGSELRRINRMLVYAAYSKLVNRPHLNLVMLTSYKPSEIRVQTLNAHEAFMIWVKAAVVTGLIFASPFIFWHIWAFVAAGLYSHEKNYVYVFLPFSLALFLAGASLAFFFVFEPVLDFLFSFNKAMNIDPDPRISEWMGFVLFLPIGFGVSFQLPLVMLFLNRIGVFSVKNYLEKWRIAILVIFVLAMFLTPADPVSMLLMAVPLTVLYFGGVLLCLYMPKMKSPFDLPEEI